MKTLSSFLLYATLGLCPALVVDLNAAAPPLLTANLGSAATLAVLGGTEVTNTGKTVITGDLGVYPAPCTSVTGFSGENAGGPGVVRGTIDDNDTGPETTAAQHGQASLTIAINDAKGRVGAFKYVEQLAGMTPTPGLYRADTTLLISGTCYLKGSGVYIFQVGTGLTVGNNVRIVLVLEDGAQAANIFWQVGTLASLGTNVIFEGNILAGTSITMTAGTTLDGRALAKAAVTFIDDTVTRP